MSVGRHSRNPWRVRKVLMVLARIVRLVSWLSAHMRDAIERVTTDDERRWVLALADGLDRTHADLQAFMVSGEAVATGQEDPRVRRRARKRPDMSTSRDAGAWMHGLYGD